MQLQAKVDFLWSLKLKWFSHVFNLKSKQFLVVLKVKRFLPLSIYLL